MFTSIIKKLLGTIIVVECNEILPNIIDDESSSIASQKELGTISGNINLKHTRYVYPFVSY